MPDSQELLAQYAKTGCEEAFRELVSRYADLVYSTASRLVGGHTQLAEDVAQTVFIDLARKARTFSPEVMLGGWLHRRTFHVATTVMRGERRRQERERKAVEMNTPDHNDTTSGVDPILDEAINCLGPEDRTAILLRFFEHYDFRAIGSALGGSEDAARMRVTRALEKLQALLAPKGVALSLAGLSTALASHAVTAAPAGLAVTLASTALASATAAAGVQVSFWSFITMAKVKTALVVAAVAGMATPLALQQRANRGLRAENEALRRQVATFEAFTTRKVSSAPRKGGMPNLPAPPMVPSAPTEPLHGLTGTNLITHILKSDKAPVLPRHQIESYLNENRRSAGSLLAAFRATQDQTLLQEAIEKYPEDPQVAYTAAYRLEGADRRQWLEAFKKAAPDNALANYLSASEHFKAGQVNQAVEELAAASRQGRFTDYTLEFGQSDEEAWRAAGYSVAEAKTIGASSLLLPHLAETKALAHQMVDLARAYRTSGDASSAELTLQMAVDLGRRLDEPDGSPLVTKLVGRAIEGIGLREMAPDTPHSRGKTAQERLAEITQERARIKEIATQFDEVAPRLSEQDWISYRDRWRMFGEEEALRWALNKHGLAVR